MALDNSNKIPRPDYVGYIRAIGHDVGAPIRHVLGFTSLLEDEIGHLLAGEARLLVDQIKASAELAEKMIYGIHDLVHLGGHIKQQAISSIRQLIQNAEDQVAAPALRVSVTGDTNVHSDPRLLSRLLANLMRNCAAYASEPQMSIRVTELESCAVLSISDPGPGIATTDWARACQPFQRIGARPTVGALGLGLSEVELIASLLEIDLEYEQLSDHRFKLTMQLPRRVG